MKKIFLFIVIILMLFSLTGCLSEEITMAISTDPEILIFDKDNLEQEFYLILKTEGGLGKIKINKIIFSAEKSDNLFIDAAPDFTAQEQTMIGGAKIKVKTKLNLKELLNNSEFGSDSFDSYYDDFLKGQEVNFKILIEGTETTTSEIKINLK